MVSECFFCNWAKRPISSTLSDSSTDAEQELSSPSKVCKKIVKTQYSESCLKLY